MIALRVDAICVSTVHEWSWVSIRMRNGVSTPKSIRIVLIEVAAHGGSLAKFLGFAFLLNWGHRFAKLILMLLRGSISGKFEADCWFVFSIPSLLHWQCWAHRWACKFGVQFCALWIFSRDDLNGRVTFFNWLICFFERRRACKWILRELLHL